MMMMGNSSTQETRKNTVEALIPLDSWNFPAVIDKIIFFKYDVIPT